MSLGLLEQPTIHRPSPGPHDRTTEEACELRARWLRRAALPAGCEEFTLVLDSEWSEAAESIDALADVDEPLAA